MTFEGIEGSGKTTEIKAVARWLRTRGRRVVLTREPGGTPVGDRIRRLLLDSRRKGLSPETELFLYEVARRDHMEKVIRPALENGAFVLCDRFTDATLAYQGYGRGLSLKMIERMNEAATGGIKPDATFLLDLPVGTGLQRVRKRSRPLDRLERESFEFHKRVRNGYRSLARRDKKRVHVIDARKSKKEIFRSLCRKVETFL